MEVMLSESDARTLLGLGHVIYDRNLVEVTYKSLRVEAAPFSLHHEALVKYTEALEIMRPGRHGMAILYEPEGIRVRTNDFLMCTYDPGALKWLFRVRQTPPGQWEEMQEGAWDVPEVDGRNWKLIYRPEYAEHLLESSARRLRALHAGTPRENEEDRNAFWIGAWAIEQRKL